MDSCRPLENDSLRNSSVRQTLTARNAMTSKEIAQI